MSGHRHPVVGNYEQERKELLDPDHPRKFLWSSFDGSQDAQLERERLEQDGAVVLNVLWSWHVLACSPELSIPLRRRMVKSFLTCMKAEDAAFRGTMFGYPAGDVSWYLRELENALDRAFAYLSATKEVT